MADTARCDSVMSLEDDADQQQGLAGAAGVLSQSLASFTMTELSSLYSMGEDVSPCYLQCESKNPPEVFWPTFFQTVEKF